jgi:hypothetical protein
VGARAAGTAYRSRLTGDLVVTGNVRATGYFEGGAGSLAAVTYRFAGSGPGTGFFAATADALQGARLGVSQQRWLGTAIAMDILTSLGTTVFNTGIRVTPTVVTTTGTNLSSNSCSIVANITGAGTINLPTAPGAGQVVLGVNVSASALTLGRNGHQINGAASDVAIAAGGYFVATYVATNDWRITETGAA